MTRSPTAPSMNASIVPSLASMEPQRVQQPSLPASIPPSTSIPIPSIAHPIPSSTHQDPNPQPQPHLKSPPPPPQPQPQPPQPCPFFHYYPGAHTTYYSTHDKTIAAPTHLFTEFPECTKKQHLISQKVYANKKNYTPISNAAVYNPIAQIFSDKGAYKFEQSGFSSDATVIVDAGHTQTRIICVWRGKTLIERRIEIGGQKMTRQLRDRISYRQLDLSSAPEVTIEHIKHKTFYVALDFRKALENSRHNPMKCTYVLPNGSNIKKGYIKTSETPTLEDEQVVTLTNERFSIPELLFNPSDIGVNQAGVPEVIMEAVSNTDPSMHGLFYANIVLIGGCSRIPGFKERIANDLRSIVSSQYDLRIYLPPNPESFVCQGSIRFAQQYPDAVLAKAVDAEEAM